MGLYKFTALIFFSVVLSFSAFAQTDTVCTSNTTDTLYINSVADADSFLWSVPPGAIITSGQYDTLIVVNWAGAVLGLDSVCVTALNECGASGTTCILTFVKAPPTPSNAGPNINVCNVTSVNMAGNTPTQGVGTWTKLSGPAGETITSPNSATTSITGLIAGSYSFMWSIANSPCGTSTDTVDVNIDALPTVANAGINDTICSSSYTLAGNNPVIGSGTWSLISGAGTVTTPGAFNSGITGIGFGSNTFRWTITNGVCAASVDDVVIQRDVPPSTSNAGPNQNICSSSTNFQGNNPAEGSGQWTIFSGAGTISNQFLYNSALTALGAGVNQFIWTTSQGVCPVSRDTVDITRDIPIASIDAGPDQNLCNITTATLAGNTPAAGETGTWSTVAGTGSASAVNNPSSGVTGLTVGASSTFRWTINTLYGVCPDSTEDIIINVDPATTIANAGPDQNLCNVVLTVLAANNPVGGESGLWTKLSGPGIISTSTSATSALTGLTNGSTTVLVWTISPQFGGCSATSDTVEINVDPTTTIAAAGADQNLCNITTATLAANAVGAGETGAWSVISGTASVTTPSSPTSGVTALTIGASSTLVWTITPQFGGCLATTDTMLINVDPSTTIANANADQDLCNITTATLAANAVGAGETGAWSVISGTASVTTPSSATSGVTALTIGASSTLVWTITPQFGGCLATTDTMLINVDPTTTIANANADQDLCNIATATLAANAVGVGETGAWSVISGTASVTTPSSPTSGVTALTIGASSTLVWTITPQFGACSATTDTMLINVDPTTTIANANADQDLCNITTATLAGNAVGVGETGAWSVISGTASVTTPSSPTSGVTALTIGASSTLVWTITPQFGGCLATTDTMLINVDPNTTIANANADQDLCNITTATLAGNAVGVGETGAWTVISGTASVTTPSSATSGVTALTIGASSTLVWTITPQFGGCPATTDTMLINVDPTTTIANANADQDLCNITTATLAANAVGVGETGAWSVISGTASVTTPSSPTSGVTALTIGASSTLVWTITPQFGGCPATTDTMLINVDPTTTIANANADQDLCNITTATLAANAVGVGETGAWSVISGTASVTTPSSPTSGVTALTIGASSTLVWTITPQFGGCPATTDTMLINVDPTTTTANANADQNLCNITTATLAANAAGVGETGAWSVISGTASVTTPSSATSGVTALTIGASSTLVWTITPQFGGCIATTDTMVINIDPTTTTANAGTDQNLCNINTTTLAGNSVGVGETGAWTVIAGTATVTTPSSPISGVTTLNIGDSSILVWTITPQFGGCFATTDTMLINVDPTTTIANANADQDLCNITTATLSANVVGAGETGAWSVISGTASVTTPSSPSSGVTALTIGASSTLVWTITPQFGGCLATTDTMLINVDPTTTIANAGPDQNLCNQVLTVLAANSVAAGESGLWTKLSGPGLISSPTSPNSALTGLTNGSTTVLVWTITTLFGGCSATSDTVEINVDPTTTIANANADQDLCNITTATLAGNAVGAGETGAWSVISGTASVTTPSSATSGVTALTIGASSTLVWTITPQFGGCLATTDTMLINVDPSTTIANANADQDLCNITTATLAGNAVGVGETGAWSVISGTASVTTPSSATSGVTALTIGASSTLVWTITPQFGGCLATTDTMLINVDPTTTIANANADQDLCNITTATLAGNAVGAGETGAWSVISGTASVTTPSSPTSGVTALTIGASSTLVWTITPQFGGCLATTDTMFINVDPTTTIANANADQDLCNITTATLSGNAVGAGETGAWSVISGTASVTTPSSPTSGVTALTIGASSTLVWTITPQFGGCLATTDTMLINVDPTTTIANANADQDLCNITTATLAGNAVGAGETGAWSVISGTASVTTPSSATSGVTALTIGASSTLVWTITPQFGGCLATTDTMLINVDPTTTIANANADQDLCNITTATLAANAVGAGETGAWSVISGTASVTTPSSPTSGVTALTIGASSTLVWTITPQFGGCPATTDTMVINVDPTTTIANANTDQDLCNITTATLAANAVGVGETGAWSVISGTASVTTPSSATSGVTALTIGASSTLVWTITPQFGGCLATTDTMIINVDPSTTIANANADQDLCNITTATLAANAVGVGETGAWSVISGTASVTTPSSATSGVTALTIGASSTLVWTITPQFGGCLATTDTMLINVDPTTTIANANADQDLCNITTATLAGNAVGAGETGAWSVISGTASVTTPSSATSGVTALTIGASSTLVWTITPQFGGCLATTDTMLINVDPTTTIANANADQDLCNITTATLAANAVGAGETGAWSVISGTASVTTPSSATSGVTALTIGASSTLVWTITPQFGGCPATTDTMLINVDPTTTIANANADQDLCNIATATLAANAVGVGETGAWSVISGTASVTTPSSATSGVTALTIGASSTLVWTITPQFGGCLATTDTMLINVDPSTTIANANADQDLCNITTATLAANAVGVGETGAWSVISGTASVTTPSSATSGVTALTIGASSTLVWTITPQFGGCSATTDTMLINVDPSTTIANAGSDQALCASSTSMTANAAAAYETGIWTLVSGVATITDTLDPTTGINSLVAGDSAIFAWTIYPQFAGCSISSDTVVLRMDSSTTLAAAGPDQYLCNITTATLAANTPKVAETAFWTIITGTATITDTTDPVSAISGLLIGDTVTLQWNINSGFGGCPTTTDQITIYVDSLTTVSNAGIDQNLCNLPSTVLSANTPKISEVGQWSVISGPALVFSVNSPNSSVFAISDNTISTLVWTITPLYGGCAVSTDTMLITVDPVTTISNAGPDQNLCSTSGTTLSANATAASETGTWVTISGPGIADSVNLETSPVSGLTPNSSTVLVWTITSLYGGCPATNDTVIINVDSAMTIAAAGSDQYLCNIVNTTLAGNSPAVTETGTWSIISGTGNVTGINDPLSTINSLTLSDSTVLVWTITSQFGGCSPTSDTIVIYVDVPVTTAELGSDYKACNVDSIQVFGNAFAANEFVTWNIINGTGTIASQGSQSTWLNGLTIGDTTTVTYTISSLFGGCPPDVDTVLIFIDNTTTIANAGPDQSLCNVASTTLSGNAHASYETGEWVIQSGAATLSATTDSIVTLLNLDPGDSIVVTWAISSAYGGCLQTIDTIVVMVDPTLTVANAGADQHLCDTTAGQLAGNSPLPSETGTWTVLYGSVVIADINDSASAINSLTVGDSSVVVWTISSQFGGCTSSSDTMTVSVDFAMTIANAGADQFQCNTISTIISANAPSATETGTWNIINGGTASVATPNSPVAPLTGFNPGDTIILTWTISSYFGGCAPSVDTITVISYENSTVANAGLDTSQCKAFTTYNLKANTPTAGVGVWTVISGSGLFGDPNDPNTTVSGLAFGTNTLQWTITNGVCASDSDVVDITLINCNPQFVDGLLNPLDTLYVTTNEDSAITVCVGMIDVDGDSVDITSGSSLSGNGSVNVNPLGDTCFVFTPNLNYNGQDTLMIFGCDSAGICDSLIVIVTIDSVNTDTPQIVDSLGNDLDTLYLTVYEDSSVSHCFDFVDADGDSVMISTSTAPLNGSVQIDSDSCFTYIPDSNYYGIDVTTLIACDPTGLCDTVLVIITVIPDTTTDPPVIVDSVGNHMDTLYLTVNEDSMITHCFTIIEPDSQTVTLTNIIIPNNGGLVINNDSCFTYTPDSNYYGGDVTTLIACDNTGLCDTVLVIITVIPDTTTDPPVIVDSVGNHMDTLYLTVNEDSMITHCFTIIEPDSQTVTLTNIIIPNNGGLVINNDSCFTYTPDSNYYGGDITTMIACDNTGLCDTVLVIITVIPDTTTDPPVIVDSIGNHMDTLYLTVNEDSMITHCFTIIEPDSQTVTLTNIIIPSNGGLVINNDSCFTYTPDSNYYGADVTTLIACDPTGLCDTVLVIITVIPDTTTDPPVIVDSVGNHMDTLYLTVNEDSMITHCFTIIEPDSQTVTLTNIVIPTNGGLVINNDSCFTYTPDSNYYGGDITTMIACDNTGLCDTVLVIITVIPDTTTDPPVIVDSVGNHMDTLYLTVNEDSMITHCFTIIEPDSQTVTLTNIIIPSNGGLVINNDSCFTYTPDSNYYGADVTTLIACDPTGLCDTVLVIITVIPDTTTDPPVIVDSIGNHMDTLYLTVNEDSMITHCFTIIEPDSQTVTLTNIIIPSNGGLVINNDSCFTYTPDSNYYGADVTTLIACDPTGLCDTVLVIITVIPDTTTDPPVIVDSVGNHMDTLYLTVNEDSMITHCFTIIEPDSQTVTLTNIIIPSNGGLVINNDSCFTYTPDTNYYGGDVTTIIACDNTGLCDTVLVIITVIPDTTTDPPVIVDSVGNHMDTLYLTVNEDSMITHCFTIIEPDSQTVTLTNIIIPSNGGLVINNDSCFTYTPDTNYYGGDVTTIIACDNTGLCDTVLVIITVIPDTTTDPPVIVDSVGNHMDTLYLTVNEDSMITHCFTIIEPDSQTVTLTNIVIPTNGGLVINNDSCFTYTPDTNYYGGDITTMIACDNTGLCDTVLVIITVIPDTTTDPPVIVDSLGNHMDTLYLTVNEDSMITHCFTIIEPDSQTVTLTNIVIPTNGGLVINNDSCFTYTPDSNYYGGDITTMIACDNTGLCDTVLVIITVVPVDDDAPAFVDSSGNHLDTLYLTVNEDSMITHCFTIVEVDGQPVNITNTILPLNGNIVVNNDSCFTYTPVPNYFGGDTAQFIACDSTGLCDTITVIIDVLPVNDDNPIIVDGSGNPIDTIYLTTPEEIPLFVCVDVIDTDLDSVDVTGGFNLTGNGSIQISPSGDTCFVYIPALNFVGLDTNIIFVCDQTGACDTLIVIVDVTPVNDYPVIVDSSGNNLDSLYLTVIEDSSVTYCFNFINVDGDSISISTLTPPANGTVVYNNDSCFTYTPTPNYFGGDTMWIQACDDGALCDSVIVFIDVIPTDDTLQVLDTLGMPTDTLYAVTCEEVPIVLCLNVTSPDGDTVDVVAGFSLTGNGSVNTLPVGDTCFTYIPNTNFFGIDTLLITVCDEDSICLNVYYIIDVCPINDPPNPITDIVEVCENDSIIIDALANDTDLEGDSLIIAINTGFPIANGTAYIDTLGMMIYTPNTGFSGIDTVEYIVLDNGVPAQSAIGQVIITVNALPILTAIHTDVNCFAGADGTIDLTVTGTGPYLYSWSNSETTEDIIGLIPGIYMVTVTDSITGCSDTLSITISEPANPLSVIMTTFPAGCYGDSTGAASVAVSGGTSPYLYQWSTSVMDTTDSISGLYSATYTVTITDANNCIYVISDSVAQPAAPLSVISNLTNILCFGDSTGAIDITIAGGTMPYTYLWNNGVTTEDINGLTVGTYTVTVTDTNGCTISDVYILTEPVAPISMTYTTTAANCLFNIGGNIDITVVGGVAPYLYSWNTGQTSEDLIGIAADTFTVTITDLNGCILIATVILEDSSSIVTTNTSSLEFCDGDSVELSTTVYPGATYQWSVNGGPITNAINPSFVATVAGDYTVTMTNLCGTFVTGSATVIVNALPSVTISEDDEVCNGQSIMLDATGGSTYEWIPATGLDDPYLPNPLASPLVNTVYTVIVTSVDGCITIDSVEVTICDSIFIPTGFSPNGDGKNDVFEIPGSIYYPDNILKIFNRWGNVVYEADGYKNDWNGDSNVNNVLFGKQLPEATYYYIFDPNVPGIEAQMGFVVIKR